MKYQRATIEGKPKTKRSKSGHFVIDELSTRDLRSLWRPINPLQSTGFGRQSSRETSVLPARAKVSKLSLTIITLSEDFLKKMKSETPNQERDKAGKQERIVYLLIDRAAVADGFQAWTHAARRGRICIFLFAARNRCCRIQGGPLCDSRRSGVVRIARGQACS